MSFLERLVNKVICKGDNIEFVDSGIEWVGPIPATWSIFPACGVFCEVKEKNTNGEYHNPFSFRYGEIVNKKIAGEIDESVEETLSTYRVVVPDTIMINGLNLNYDFISQRVAIVRDKGIITSAYLAVQPDKNKVVPRFVLYLLKAYDYRQVFHGLGSGIRKTLKYQDFKKIKIVAQSLAEQEAIVAYLDFQCEQIDCIIFDAKASIEEYKSWKASIIYEAVTKGLDPNVKMKDSGIKWIGDIPHSWDVLRLKYVIASIESGVSVNTSQSAAEEGKIGVLKTSSVSKYSFRPEENKEVNLEELDRISCPVRANAIIVSRMNTPELVGACGYVEQDYPNLFLPDRLWQVHFLNSVVVKYIWYYLSSNYIRNYYSSLSSGTSSSMQNISQGQFENARLLLPPPEVQRDIVEFLDKKCATLDSLVAEKESLIADLEAYKKSLIFEVVTGKRRVV